MQANQKLNPAKYNFNEDEVQLIKQRFDKYAQNGIMDKYSFREMLGILGTDDAPFLSDRIFYVIDQNGCDMVNLDNFMSYLDIMINGDEIAKAKLSFKFIDQGNKMYIDHSDIEKLIQGVSTLWNNLSGSKIVPQKYYIDQIIGIIDFKKTGQVSFSQYLETYQKQGNQIDWFQYFNSDQVVDDGQQQQDEMLLKIENEKKNRITQVKNYILQIEEEVQQILIKIKESEKKQIEQFSPITSRKNQQFQPIQSPLISNNANSSQLQYNFSNISPLRKRGSQNIQFNNQMNNNYANTNDQNVSNFLSELDFPTNQFFQNNNNINNININMNNNINQNNTDIRFNTPLNLPNISSSQIYTQQQQNQYQQNSSNQIIQTQRQNNTTIKEFTAQNNDPNYVKSKQQLAQMQSEGQVSYTGPIFINTQTDYNSGDQGLIQGQDGSFEVESDDDEGEDFQKVKEKINQMESDRKDRKNQDLGKELMSMDDLYSNEYDQKLNLLSILEEKIQLILRYTQLAEDLLENKFEPSYKNSLNALDRFNPLDETESEDNSSYVRMRRCTINKIPKKRFKKGQQQKIKQNLQIYIGHENWNIILNLMIGIRSTTKNVFAVSMDPSAEDFKQKKKENLISQLTQDDSIRKAYSFVDYCPVVFDCLRREMNISRESYLRTVGPETILGNLIMGRMNSLTELCRFDQKKNRMKFMVVGHIFSTSLSIEQRYELKGSTYKRTARKKEGEQPEKDIAFKDQDFIDDQMKFSLEQKEKEKVLIQFQRDLEFLKYHQLFNYRLLVGFHKQDINKILQHKNLQFLGKNFRNSLNQTSVNGAGVNLNNHNSQQNQQKNEERSSLPGFNTKEGEHVVFMGILNFLKRYQATNQVTHFFTSTFTNNVVSTVPPDDYANRMFKFISDYVLK
ncbi:hypothetical protein PPERSA_07219 [Pseudocohnilembus persalinus]|uniref:PIPK domain-containing protein n=1 Tax=Pseudocohnilembus persalinus TaxID=266149 RepID=A0A0V0QDA3_PSEPJ|nr:hypothetical protein PPERSA_07219 [Pseudocohnilembus persalinus]|eukprot:KRX00112.1 hypothetical protein PPERSA_07219 [Pseudocohnilembus persalinus]